MNFRLNELILDFKKVDGAFGIFKLQLFLRRNGRWQVKHCPSD